MPRASTTSLDQSRSARSNRSVPAPSARSTAKSPVSAVPDEVLRQQDVLDPRPDIGFVVLHPHELRRRETGERVVAGDPYEALRADRFPDPARIRPPCVGRSTGWPDGGPVRLHPGRPVRASARRARPPGRPRRGSRIRTRAARTAPTVASHHRCGSCSLHSGRGVSYGYSTDDEATMAPEASSRTAFVAVVETSRPRTRLMAPPVRPWIARDRGRGTASSAPGATPSHRVRASAGTRPSPARRRRHTRRPARPRPDPGSAPGDPPATCLPNT